MKRRAALGKTLRGAWHAFIVIGAIGAIGIVSTIALSPRLAWADKAPVELNQNWTQAQLAGEGELRFFGLHIYDSRLWIPVGTNPRTLSDDWTRQTLALEIEYARRFDGRDIAQRSIKEMKRQAQISDEASQRWMDLMTRVIPDVDRGDRITGIHMPGERTRFFHNGRYTGEIADADFTRLFFGIWLSPKTSEPALRAALLGIAAKR